MKRTTYYPSLWQAVTIPYALEWSARLERKEMPIKELILENSYAHNNEVCHMDLNITKFSAIDSKGYEHEIMKFPNSSILAIKGISECYFIKTKTLTSLKPSIYHALRFYIKRNQNYFTYSDGVKKEANKFDYIDFEIQNGLVINKDEIFEAKIWFDLPSYQFSRHFKPLIDWFKNLKNIKREFAKA